MSPINSKELFIRLQNEENLNLLDVREEIEYHTYNIGGKNIPLSRFEKSLDQIGYNKNDEIIVVCRAGIRSETVRIILEEKGYLHVRNLTGGLIALQKLK